MLREIASDLWVAEQPLRYFGLEVGTRMTVVRLSNGELALISPIQLDDALTQQLNELGPVQQIVAPNLYHHLFAAAAKQRYPDATLWAVPGLAAKQPELPIDAEIEGDRGRLWDTLDYCFIAGLNTLSLSGPASLQECAFYHAASRTLILTDAAFHFDESVPTRVQLAARLLGSYQQLAPSLLERLATRDRASVRRSLAAILNWDFERVIVAHGRIVERAGKAQLQQGYEQFLGQALSGAG